MRHKVLVVDNHPMILKLMSNLLEKEGHDVKVAIDGLSALDILKAFKPDIIFVDLIMPNISGDKLCRIIRSMPEHQDTYLVVLSAIAAEEEIDFTAFGADACIGKGPFKNIAKHVSDLLSGRDRSKPKDFSRRMIGGEDIYGREVTRELLSSKRHFEVILKNMSEGILELTPEARVIYVNPAAAALLGRSEEKILGDFFPSFVQGENRQRMADLLEQSRTGQVATDDDSPLVLNGRLVSFNFLPVLDEEDRSCIVIASDITDRKKAEEKISEQNRFLKKLLESLSHPFYVVDARNYRIIHANSAARKELGFGSGATRCYEMGDDGAQDDKRATYPCPLEPIKKSGKSVTVEYVHQDKEGRAVVHEIHAYPIFDDKGRIVQAIQYNLDITERKRADEALRSSTARLRQAMDELKKAQAMIVRQEKLASIGTLASGVAHEILNPLNIIGTIIQVLQMEDNLPVSVRENIDDILLQIRRATKITNNLRMFSHSHEQATEIQRINVNDLFDQTANLLEHDFSLDNIIIERDLDPALPAIEASGDQLAQVFINLLNNAKGAMKQGEKKIRVRTRATDDGIEIRFADTGSGIPREHIDKIFDPFFTTKDPGSGTGLGLSIVYSIIENHGGTIQVESEQGRGATFIIRLPEKSKPRNAIDPERLFR